MSDLIGISPTMVGLFANQKSRKKMEKITILPNGNIGIELSQEFLSLAIKTYCKKSSFIINGDNGKQYELQSTQKGGLQLTKKNE